MTINYQYTNLLSAGSFGLNVLSPDDIEQIHIATLNVLWNIGLKVMSPNARVIFGDSGCVVDEKNQIVKIPSHIVEDAIQSTPATFRAHAINPDNGQMVVIEMNPRVSRSSALASKATGFPIAKIAAKLAVGLTLDEIPNDITKETPASFEPAIDYVVVKFPRFAFEKFPEADSTLTTQMKSVGEVMSIGRTFKEALLKAVRSLEIESYGFETVKADIDEIKTKLKIPGWDRIWYLAHSFRQGMSIDEIHGLTLIDPWFLYNIKQIIDLETEIKNISAGITKEKSLSMALHLMPVELLRKAKEYGFPDRRIAHLL